MEKVIYDESNHLTYTLGDDGFYYPNLTLPTYTETYGKYGRIYHEYLKKHRQCQYAILCSRGKLHDELCRMDREATKRVADFVEKLAKQEHTDEALKACDPIRWTGLMNCYQACAEEVVLQDYIYG